MAAARVIISLGSNLGDREASILEAISSLDSNTGIDIVRLSPLFETDPVGEGYSSRFINAIAIIDTTLSPEQLLSECKRIELLLGRNAERPSGDRTIDIDIIDFGHLQLESEHLVLPHPRAAQRSFVLLPLSTVDPGFIFPGSSRRVADIEGDKMPGGSVRKISSRKVIDIELLEK